MNMSSPLLQSEVLEIIKSRNSIQFEDLVREIRKVDPAVQEKDTMGILLKLELLGMITVRRLAKKNLLIEFIKKEQNST